MPNRRKSVDLLKLQGTFRPARHTQREDELRVSLTPPEAPAWLSASARAEWDRVLSDPRYARALTGSDRGMLAVYATLWSEPETAAVEGKTLQTSRIALFANVCA